MKTVIYTVNSGKYEGQSIVEQTSASFDMIRLRGLALGWTVKHIYIA